MATTTVSSIGGGQHASTVGRRDLARYVVHLAGTFALNAAVLVAGVRLTGLSWSELCFLVLPPMMAGSGAVLTFFALNWMALRSEVAAADSPPGHADVVYHR